MIMQAAGTEGSESVKRDSNGPVLHPCSVPAQLFDLESICTDEQTEPHYHVFVKDTSIGETAMNTQDIRNRKSVRTFEKEPLSDKQLQNIKSCIDTIDTPFGVPVHLELLNKEEYGLNSPVIVNDSWYVAGKVPKTDAAEEAYGYAFEDFILKMQSMGIGTVWLAATMSRRGFEEALNLQEGEVMPAVSPVGHAAASRSKREILMRKGMNSDNRQPFESRFFEGSFDTPLQQSKAGKWAMPLEMVRLAPSATNKQPWRVIVDGNTVYFFEKKTKGYASEKEGDIQKVDLGIAMRHFDLACEEAGIKGHWEFTAPAIALPANTDYIATWAAED